MKREQEFSAGKQEKKHGTKEHNAIKLAKLYSELKKIKNNGKVKNHIANFF